MNYISCIFLFFSISLFAEQSIKNKEESLKELHLKSLNNKDLSKKEKAFQKYKEELEKENQKLEDDGFCSCNNN